MKIKLNRKEIEVNENIVDRFVNYFNPIKGRERFKSRIQTAVAGGYIGGSQLRRETKGWIVSRGDSDSDLLPDLALIRERSRDLERNNPIASGALDTAAINVLGSGLTLYSRIDNKILNLSEEEKTQWEDSARREWRLFSESKECDIARTCDFAGLAEMVFRSYMTNGDVFISMPSLPRTGGPFKLKLQAIEADRVSNPHHTSDTIALAGGVEKDSNGAPKFYHIARQHPGNFLAPRDEKWDRVAAFGSKTGRRNVLHLFRQERPGQTRGVPWFSPVIETFKQLGRYTEAELMAAVVSAFFTVFVKTESGESLGPMEPIIETGAKTTDKDFKMGNGAILDLAKGEDIEIANPGRPNTSFDKFVQAILEQVGMGLGIPFEILRKRFSASFSASKGSLVEGWKFFINRREFIASNFHQPSYEALITESVANGRLSAPGFFDNAMIRKAWLGSEWVGSSQTQIDEVKAANAAKIRMESKTKTLDQETRALGGDYEKNLSQLRIEAKDLAELNKTSEPDNDTENDDNDTKNDETDQSKGDKENETN